MRGKTKMEGEKTCREINIKIVDCLSNKPRFILLDPDSYTEFERYQESSNNLPPVAHKLLGRIPRTHQGLELLMVMKQDKFIEVV